MPPTINEQAILDSLRQLPEDRWGEVIKFIDELGQTEPSVHTLGDPLQSDLVGLWADRDDIEDNHAFARQLRRQAESRQMVIAGLRTIQPY